MDPRVKPTTVRFKIVDKLHGIDSTVFKTFTGVLDTDRSQHHAASQ